MQTKSYWKRMKDERGQEVVYNKENLGRNRIFYLENHYPQYEYRLSYFRDLWYEHWYLERRKKL